MHAGACKVAETFLVEHIAKSADVSATVSPTDDKEQPKVCKIPFDKEPHVQSAHLVSIVVSSSTTSPSSCAGIFRRQCTPYCLPSSVRV